MNNPPDLNHNPGSNLGTMFVDKEVIAATLATIFVPASEDEDVIRWKKDDGGFSFSFNRKEDIHKTIEAITVFLNRESRDPIIYKFPVEVFLDMLLRYWEKFPFWNDMCDEGDKKYGQKNWSLDYYLCPPKQFGEKYEEYECAVMFMARGKNGEDLS